MYAEKGSRLLLKMSFRSLTSVQLFHDGGISYRNQSINFLNKLVDWFLDDRDLRQDRFNSVWAFFKLLRASYITFIVGGILSQNAWLCFSNGQSALDIFLKYFCFSWHRDESKSDEAKLRIYKNSVFLLSFIRPFTNRKIHPLQSHTRKTDVLMLWK